MAPKKKGKELPPQKTPSRTAFRAVLGAESRPFVLQTTALCRASAVPYRPYARVRAFVINLRELTIAKNLKNADAARILRKLIYEICKRGQV